MTFVLILAPASLQGWPAVIGGYTTEAMAVAAGEQATMAPMTQEGFENASWGMGSQLPPIEFWLWIIWRDRPWVAFTVVPGGVGHEARVHNASNTPGEWAGHPHG